MSGQQARSALERSTMRKLTIRIVPYLTVCYFFALLDRSNIGVASLQMNSQLGLTAAAYGLGGSLFFLGYFLFEVPSNVMLHRYGARRWLGRIMVTWGLMCVLMALTQGPKSLYALRFLLGVAEAGFFPGILLYITYWFPTRYRAQVITAFSVSNALASFVGSPVSASLLLADGFLELHGWQWIFIVEGLPTVLLGIACWVILTDKPAQATWLASEQREWLIRRLASEEDKAPTIGPKSVLQLACDPYIWGLTLTCSAASSVVAVLAVWQPQLIKTFDLSSFQTGLVNAVPYGISVVLMIFWGMHSDRTGERRWHTALPLFVIAAGFAGLFLSTASLSVTMALLSCVLVSYASFKGPFWALSATMISPASAAVGIAGINAVSNLVAGVMVWLVGLLKEMTGSFAVALMPMVGLAAMGGLIILMMTRHKLNLGGAAMPTVES
jgi:MFS transporter, ACS family, tartrate transporter